MKSESKSVLSPEEWGRIIDHTRIKFHLRVKDLSKETKMSPSTYTKLEKGAM